MRKDKYYITTTLAYVNAAPHLGFAAEIVRADFLARWHRQMGDEVIFNTGTDDHGQKIYEGALKEGKNPQDYCDFYAAKFEDLKKAFNLSYTNFIRTTDEHHIKAAQEFWKLCEKNGDIYKKEYKVKYCVGCELEKTDSELENGKCPLHPTMEIELINEENYFFRWSKYQEKLLKFYKDNPNFVVPSWRLNEIRNFVEAGLNDFSISRLKEKMPWGIPVPGDPDQVMYVWFDALVNYIAAIGYPDKKYQEWWPAVQVCGKDNLRQQSAMWQAMLMSAGIANSKQILVFGFITSDGQKMSKSLGNVINPFELVEKYGTDAVRYYILAGLAPFEDSDYSKEKFEAIYTADLANGLGNLVARVSNLLEKNEIELDIKNPLNPPLEKGEFIKSPLGRGEGVGKNNKTSPFLRATSLSKEFDRKVQEYDFNGACKILWDKIQQCDAVLTKEAPWKIKDDKEKVSQILKPIAQDILDIGYLLEPIMPETSEKIVKQFSAKQIKKGEPLFPRIEV